MNNYSISLIPEAKCLWFRVPKAGKTTIKMTLQHYFPYSRKYPKGYFTESFLAEHSDWFWFAFVREPIERFISVWNHMMVTNHTHGIYIEKDEKWKDINYLAEYVTNSKNAHFLPQTEIIPESVDYIGRFSHFEKDLKEVFERLGKNLSGVRHLNKANAKLFPELSESSIKLLKNYYQLDYNKYGGMF